jgi:hypothetical protein
VAQPAAERVGGLAQQLVPGVMTVGVVDLLEAVEIEQQQRRLDPRRGAARELGVERGG